MDNDLTFSENQPRKMENFVIEKSDCFPGRYTCYLCLFDNEVTLPKNTNLLTRTI